MSIIPGARSLAQARIRMVGFVLALTSTLLHILTYVMRPVGTGVAAAVRIGGKPLQAIGVVFGDIFTSVMYAMREIFLFIPATRANILGVMFWIVVMLGFVGIKYGWRLLKVDHNGEGGVTALTNKLGKRARWGASLGMIVAVGAMWADGGMTPIITISAAVETLKYSIPVTEHYSPFITWLILTALFAVQSKGTERISKITGPWMACFGAMITTFGLVQIVQNPDIFNCFNPAYGIALYNNYPEARPLIIGGLTLVATGGEALFADLAHFGATAIMKAWWGVVIWALLINYMGQGAYLLNHPEAAKDPFFAIVPLLLAFPVFVVCGGAAVFASQSLISAWFSQGKQLVEKNILPHMTYWSTSEHEHGQTYVPTICLFLYLECTALLAYFQFSERMAGAYGIAVTVTMLISSLLYRMVLRLVYNYSFIRSWISVLPFIIIESFLVWANMHKFMDGGYIALGITFFAAFGMEAYWLHGRLIRRIKKGPVAKPVIATTSPTGTILPIVFVGTIADEGTCRTIEAASLLAHDYILAHVITRPTRVAALTEHMLNLDPDHALQLIHSPTLELEHPAIAFATEVRRSNPDRNIWIIISQPLLSEVAHPKNLIFRTATEVLAELHNRTGNALQKAMEAHHFTVLRPPYELKRVRSTPAMGTNVQEIILDTAARDGEHTNGNGRSHEHGPEVLVPLMPDLNADV